MGQTSESRNVGHAPKMTPGNNPEGFKQQSFLLSPAGLVVIHVTRLRHLLSHVTGGKNRAVQVLGGGGGARDIYPARKGFEITVLWDTTNISQQLATSIFRVY
jgi:hypothetical protein